MEVTKEYSIAYVQVLEVLKRLNKHEYEKIPKERIELYEKYKDNEYTFVLDETVDFNEQISNKAQAIIANLFVRFIATPKDRKEIYENEKAKFIEEELVKRKNINIKPLFSNKDELPPNNQEQAIIIKETGFIKNIFNKIRNFFLHFKYKKQ